MSAGYAALHESAAWLDLSGRGKIRVTGQDRARLLHAILSNEVQKLGAGQGNYHFLLDAQGHILADANLYVFADSILLDCELELAGIILEHLDRYIVADDVQLENITDRLATIAAEGPRAEEMAGVAVPVGLNSHIEIHGVIVARTSATGQPGLWFFVDSAQRDEWITRLEQAGAIRATAGDARVVRVENGLPRYGEDFGAANLPQETQQARALNFNKGCYLGQEIVERIRSRGQVHRLLVKVGIEGEESPPSGAAVLAGDKGIGRLTSPVYSPRLGRSLGLAIVRREFASRGASLTITGRPAQVL